eukprot:GHVT01072710.1.p1 GENE.GHVT01072710.1~~GHVT01072710.1.p1  ORF type:complete len:315 (-),score=86.80 GHVT01072710.1:521-1465(-)
MEKSHGQGPACDAVEAQYKSLPCKLEPIPGSSRVYAAVRLLLLRTHAPTHGYWRLKLRQLFAYQPKAGADALPPDGLGVKLCLGPEPHDHKDDRNSHSNSSSDSSSSNSSSNSSSDSSSDSSSSNSSSDSGSSNSDSNSSSESVSKGSSSGSTFFGGSGVSLLGSRMLWHGSRLVGVASSSRRPVSARIPAGPFDSPASVCFAADEHRQHHFPGAARGSCGGSFHGLHVRQGHLLRRPREQEQPILFRLGLAAVGRFVNLRRGPGPPLQAHRSGRRRQEERAGSGARLHLGRRQGGPLARQATGLRPAAGQAPR